MKIMGKKESKNTGYNGLSQNISNTVSQRILPVANNVDVGSKDIDITGPMCPYQQNNINL